MPNLHRNHSHLPLNPQPSMWLTGWGVVRAATLVNTIAVADRWVCSSRQRQRLQVLCSGARYGEAQQPKHTQHPIDPRQRRQSSAGAAHRGSGQEGLADQLHGPAHMIEGNARDLQTWPGFAYVGCIRTHISVQRAQPTICGEMATHIYFLLSIT
jgi:hypothetical protein